MFGKRNSDPYYENSGYLSQLRRKGRNISKAAIVEFFVAAVGIGVVAKTGCDNYRDAHMPPDTSDTPAPSWEKKLDDTVVNKLLHR